MKTIIIGDIHGRYNQLRVVLDLINFDPTRDRLICLGDYLNYGPDSQLVVNYLIYCGKQSPRHLFLRGNHESTVLDCWSGLSLRAGFLNLDPGMRTVRSYGRDPDEAASRSRKIADREGLKEFVGWIFPSDHLEFFNATVPCAWLDKIFTSHAGLIRDLPIEAHKPDYYYWGDRSWVDTRSPDDQPPVVCGHWHQPEEPLVEYKKILMAVQDNLAVLWLEEQTIINSEGISWPIDPDWQLVKK
jgi:hypothetical protein